MPHEGEKKNDKQWSSAKGNHKEGSQCFSNKDHCSSFTNYPTHSTLLHCSKALIIIQQNIEGTIANHENWIQPLNKKSSLQPAGPLRHTLNCCQQWSVSWLSTGTGQMLFRPWCTTNTFGIMYLTFKRNQGNLWINCPLHEPNNDQVKMSSSSQIPQSSQEYHIR